MGDSQYEAGIRDAAQARAELHDTLEQLRYRLDYAQRIDDSVDRVKHRIAAERRENPVGFAVGVALAAAVVGAAAWGVTAMIRRAFR